MWTDIRYNTEWFTHTHTKHPLSTPTHMQGCDGHGTQAVATRCFTLLTAALGTGSGGGRLGWGLDGLGLGVGGAGGHVQPRLGHAVLLLHHYLAGLLRRLEGDGLGGVRRRYAHLAENSGQARLGFVLCPALVCPPCSKQWAGKVRFCVVCGSGMATSLKTVGRQGLVLYCVLPTSLKTVGGQGSFFFCWVRLWLSAISPCVFHCYLA